MDAPVLPQLLFYIRADWGQLAGGEGCSAFLCVARDTEAITNRIQSIFTLNFLNAPPCNIQPDHIFPLYGSRISTLTSIEEAELSPLTASNQG